MPIEGRRPYTEIFEVLQNEWVREAASNEESKFQGTVNQVYLNDLPAVLPEDYIKKEGIVLTAAQYTTGTITVGTGTTNIIGVSTAWTSANSDNFLIKVSGYNQTYRMTFAVGTSLTFQNSETWTEASGSGLGYTIFQNRYSLASDFNYVVSDKKDDPNSVYRYINNVPIYLTPYGNEEFDRLLSGNTGDLYGYTVKYISGSAYIFLVSAPSGADNVRYSYVPTVVQLREHTTGTATLTTGTAVVLTSNATITTSLDTSRRLFIRNDADGTGSGSKWARISSVGGASTATLSSSFTGTSGTGISYTISEISVWPERFDDVLMYKCAWILDIDKEQAEKWGNLHSEAIGQELRTQTKRKTERTMKSFPGLRR